MSYVDHSRITCISAYLNLRTESQKHRKLNHFWEKVVMVYINIIVLDQSCCAKKIIVCLWIFSWIQQDGISGFMNQRFELWHYHWRATRQTKQSYFMLLSKKIQNNGKLQVAEPRNRSGNIFRSTISTVKLFLADSALTQQYFVTCGLNKVQAKGSHLKKRWKTRSCGKNSLISKKITSWKQYHTSPEEFLFKTRL